MKCGPDFSLENKHIGWICERPKRQGKKKKKDKHNETNIQIILATATLL